MLFVTGSAVAVEMIFSGGRDTISLHRASLNKPDNPDAHLSKEEVDSCSRGDQINLY
jgi:hypothetical protein